MGKKVKRYKGWGKKSHGAAGKPDYERIFDDGKVQELHVAIEPHDWQRAVEDMAARVGPAGSLNDEARGLLGKAREAATQLRIRRILFQGAAATDPVWVPCTVRYGGKTWRHVGFRFKGNSSLLYSWADGSSKLPFKLNFDKFADERPKAAGQRFYGFKKLSVANCFGDPTYVRDRVGSELYRAYGVPAARAASYRVSLDRGEGEEVLGLYALVESMDDTGVPDAFGDLEGNLYKPDMKGATFAKGSFDRASFVKKSNEEDADWSDIERLYEVLHSRARRKDTQQWRDQLAAVLDVDRLLRWLAVTAVIQNWDTYGKTPHNFYLYGDPKAGGRFTYLPWDLNEVLKADPNHSFPHTLSLREVTAMWPLIRFIVDDRIYGAQYILHVHRFAMEVFTPERMTRRYRDLHDQIAPYVVGAKAAALSLQTRHAFVQGFSELDAHVSSRAEAVAEFLRPSPFGSLDS